MAATRPYAGKAAQRRRRIAERDGGDRCVWCGSARGRTLEHVVPRSVGGPTTDDNGLLACELCNTLRGNRPAALWLAACVAADLAPRSEVVLARLAHLAEPTDADSAEAAAVAAWLTGARTRAALRDEETRARLSVMVELRSEARAYARAKRARSGHGARR